MHRPTIESQISDRLEAERIRRSHFEVICRLHQDEKVMRTLSAGGKVLSDETTREGLERQCVHWERTGFGLWVIRFLESREFVGRAGLQEYEIESERVVGLAYAVLSPYWGRGLATEMGRLSLDVAFGPLGLKKVSTWTLPNNQASQRVMKKLGFEYRRDFVYAGLCHRYYEIARDAYRVERKSHG